MKHKSIRIVGILVAIMIATAVLTIGINWVRASEMAIPTQTTTAQVGSSFTYQGELNDGGNPVNDTCNMVFRLYENNTQIGGNLNKNNVTVSDGIFSIELDFGDDAFTGGARALQIDVKCGSDSGYTTLTPNVTLTAAPYALSLKPGAIIQSAVSVSSTLQVINSSSSGQAYGLYGQTNSNNFDTAGVYGRATASTGTSNGVYGEANSNEGTGVYGFASANSGKNSGVYGQTWSNQGVGVYGLGIVTGTYSVANSNSGTSYGVYGESMSPDGYGLYSEGNAHINGNLTWKTLTSTISLPAAAFNPTDEGFSFDNNGLTLTPKNNSSNTYLAPVQLPQGATVTKLTFYWNDTDAGAESGVTLYRIDFAGGEAHMASAASNGSAGAGSSSDNIIFTPTVDNSQYGYYIWLTLPTTSTAMHAVVIDYTTTQPH